jgi:S-(hydroxymethyl)mycothiol dehydrogenase
VTTPSRSSAEAASGTPPSPGAALVGAKKIIAVDRDEQKLAWAREFGNTHIINATEFDVVETIQDLTDGNGAVVAIDAVGRPETWK